MSAKLFAVFLLSGVLGCAQGSIRINTSPESAEVYVSYDGGQPTKMGQTPLKLEGDNLSSRKGKFVTFNLKKDGYQTETVILPTSQFGADLNLTSKLEEYKLSLQCHDQNTAIQKVSRGTASVQYLLKAGRFTEALSQVDVLLNEFPGVSVLYDLKGNVLYLSKDLSGALAAYDKSVEIDSTNQDTQRIRAKIRGILGDRAPVNRGGQ